MTDQNIASSLGNEQLAFKVPEAAKLLGISSKSLRRLIKRGLIASSRGLRHYLVSRAEISRYLRDTSGFAGATNADNKGEASHE